MAEAVDGGSKKTLHMPHLPHGFHFNHGQRLSIETKRRIYKSVTSLYATLLVTSAAAVMTTKIVAYETYFYHLDENAFYLALCMLANAFLIYILAFTSYQAKETRGLRPQWKWSRMVVENGRSHASAMIRNGAIVFGLGSVLFHVFELITVVELEHDHPCYSPLKAAYLCSNILMITLEAIYIVVFPRINLSIVRPLDRLGTMHLFATNIIMWVRVIVKESMLEINHALHDGHNLEWNNGSLLSDTPDHDEGPPDCDGLDSEVLGSFTLADISLYLFPCAIEFSLIAAAVFYTMWKKVGNIPQHVQRGAAPVINLPNLKNFVMNRDYSHSFYGIAFGWVMLIGSFVSVGYFWSMGSEGNSYDTDRINKYTNICFGSVGLIAAIIGIRQIESIDSKTTSCMADLEEEDDDDFDISLLRFTSFFAYAYLGFTIITGVVHVSLGSESFFPGWAHIVSAVLVMGEITALLIFLIELKGKDVASPCTSAVGMPGRSMCNFLAAANLGMWLVVTFEVQSINSSAAEVEVFGIVPWVIIQRITMPLSIFFRFHAAVFSIELWKCYQGKDDEDNWTDPGSDVEAKVETVIDEKDAAIKETEE